MYGTAWKKEATSRLVQLAVSSGFTAIDMANQLIHYQEALVGEALLALDNQGIKRDALFLQTKFTPVRGAGSSNSLYDASADITTQVGQSFESSLKHLYTDYLDSYVLHGPHSRVALGAEDWECWAAIEGIYKSGRTKMIGISNVNPGQLIPLCEKAEIKPMVVQNRCYAMFGWGQEVREICQANEIIYQGFSLWTANRDVLVQPGIGNIAKRVGTGRMQVIFRFAMQLGMLPLTGTTSAQPMKEDLQVENFELTPDEVRLIERIAV